VLFKIFNNPGKFAFILIAKLVLLGGMPFFATNAITGDTTEIVLKSPDSKTESDVFSDPKLQYNLNAKYEPGMLERFVEWLSKVLFGDVEYKSISITRQAIIWLVVIICLIIAVRIIWRSSFTSLVKPQGKHGRFSFEELKDGLQAIPFEKMIKEAEDLNDWRLALRWRYLFCLYALEKKGILEFRPAKTNIDYLRDLRKTDYKQSFAELSKIYEYVWYGKFEVDKQKYSGYSELYKGFNQSLNNV
jgi:hypothetical protein